jgi:5-methyltetrahydrofolate--homocysteine methyltransferase
MTDLDALRAKVLKGDATAAVAATQGLLDVGGEVAEIVDQGLIAAMDEVGQRYSQGLFFVPQMLRSAKAMQACMSRLQPLLKGDEVASRGRVVIGTVKGDLHDIGKNLVAMMMEGAGFSVSDLGVDVPPDRFVAMSREVQADIVAMSALLSTTMPAMPDTVRALQAAGIRDRVKVMVGGAPVTQAFADKIGADAYAPEAGSAVQRARELLGGS